MNTPLCPPELNSVQDLKALQRVMGEALFAPLAKGDRLRAKWSDGRSTKSVAESFIKPNSRLTSVDRLEIYARQYWYRLLDCLYDDFPGLRALLGERKFHTLSRAYLTKYPSDSFTLRDLGSRLEQFLREEPKWAEPWTAMALDVTRFEWAQTVAFDEAGRTPLDGEDLLGTPPDKLMLGLQPYITLLELGHAVDAFFLAVRKHDSGTRSDASNAHADAPSRPPIKRIRKPKADHCFIAVHRHENQIYLKRLEPEAFRLLTALRDGATVAGALETALADADADSNQDWAAKVREWFEAWAALGWFCARR